MGEILAHLVGDYLFQNHWMATKKVTSWVPAAVHATVYTLPFLLLTQSVPALFVIWSTHLIIDRFRLVTYWADFWGVGKTGNLTIWFARTFGGDGRLITIGDEQFVPTRWGPLDIKVSPPFIAAPLLWLSDNTMHLLINHAALMWL